MNITENQQSKNNFIMGDEMFLGVFDTDGGVFIGLNSYLSKESRKNNPDNLPFGFSITYEVAQSKRKKDLVQKVAEKFESNPTSKDGNSFKVNRANPVGQKVREFLLKNNPRHPGRLHDFLISEKMIELLDQKAQYTKKGLVTLIILTYNNKRNQNEQEINFRKYPLDFWIKQINATEQEILQGKAEAALILESINKETSQLKQKLPNMKFSLEYTMGAHFGDGGFTVALSWNPSTKGDRRRSVPEWTISGEDNSYCLAFANTFDGGINKAGPNYYKFYLRGIENCAKILEIFEEALWLPEYKRQQFERFAKAVRLLVAKEHMTARGVETLVELVYDLGEKGGRPYPKEQYVEWGISWLKKNNYI